MRLEGKVALITGGARGMGAVEGRMFAREGAAVVLADVLQAQGAAVAEEIRRDGGQALFAPLDVTSSGQWARAVEATLSRFGGLHVLVNNAGILRRTPLEAASEEDWDEVMAVNAKGTFLGTRAVFTAMRAGGGGSIVNISSTAGIVASGTAGPAYGASKAAVRLFTKVTAVQWARYGVRANSIHPGPIDTDMVAPSMATPEGRASVLARVPMGRVGTPEEVAYGALFLASDESSYMTGAELVIDGGVTAW